MTNLEELYLLAQEGCLEKEKYEKILNVMIMPEVNPGDDPMRILLQKNLDEERYQLQNINENYSKMPFWSDYLYWQIWKKIRNDCLGHVVSLKTYQKRYEVEIHLELSVKKEELESQEDFLLRKKIFFQNCEYEWQKNKNINVIAILDTKENKDKLLDYLSSFMDIKRYFFETRDNLLYTIRLICSDINLNIENKEETLELNTGMLEYIMKQLKEAYHAISMAKDFPSLEPVSKHLYYSIYYDICKKLGISNDNTENYEKTFLKDKNKNIETRNLSEEVGKTYSNESMFNVVKDIKEKLENYLSQKYSLYCEDIHFDRKKLFVSCFFSDINNFDDEKNKQYFFDDIVVGNDNGYCIPMSQFEFVIDTLRKDIFMENIYLDSKNVYIGEEEIMCINKITAQIDISRIFEKFA